MGLMPMRKHAIMHKDACNLLSLQERSFLTFHELRFFYKRTFMENPDLKPSFAYFSLEECS